MVDILTDPYVRETMQENVFCWFVLSLIKGHPAAGCHVCHRAASINKETYAPVSFYQLMQFMCEMNINSTEGILIWMRIAVMI